MMRNLSTPQLMPTHHSIEEAPTLFHKKEFGDPSKLPERLLKASEVAEILNVSKAFAYQLMQQGKIRTVVMQSARRVRPKDLAAFIEASLNPPGEYG